MSRLLLAGVSTVAIFAAQQAFAADKSISWQVQINDTAAVQTAAKGGAGLTIAVLDTGVVGNNPEVNGRTSLLSSCAAVSFKCSNGYWDDNSHGTAVAAVVGGRYSTTSLISMSGVAPAATILAEKVLPATGSATAGDVANGIIKAADAGAQVINLSLTYTPTSAVVNAINYATAKNATLVWAGGNSSANFNNGASTSGLSAASLSHLVFVGGVSSTNVLASTSNKPGSGSVSGTGGSASYASLWLVAPSMGIWAPYATSGVNSFSAWTGTSMSAPQVSGALALLESAWPILYTKGTAASVLFKTATDLGATGVDATYGEGVINLDRAFKPIGALSVVTSTGGLVPVSQLTSQMVMGGALGSLSTISSQLSTYTAFDSFMRNFTVDLSGMVTSTSPGSTSTSTTTATATTSTTTMLQGGGMMVMGTREPQAFGERSFADLRGQAPTTAGLAPSGFDPPERELSLVAFSDAKGDMVAVGHGIPAAATFTEAMWGPRSLVGHEAGRLGVATALLDLAQGGYSAALGYGLSPRVHIAAGWSSNDTPFAPGATGPQTRAVSEAWVVGVNARLDHGLTIGASFSGLSEDNALLGSTYNGAGPLSLGSHHDSRSVTLSAFEDLGDGQGLLLDAAMVDTSGSAGGQGLIRDVSALQARAYGISYIKADALRAGDLLTLSVRRPLRVTSGTADLVLTTVDADGLPVTRYTRVDLAPSGEETDIAARYATPVRRGLSLNGEVEVRSNARNTQGLTDVGASMGLHLTF